VANSTTSITGRGIWKRLQGRLLLALLLALCLGPVAQAQDSGDVVPLQRVNGGIGLMGAVAYLQDDSGKLTLEDVRSRSAQSRFVSPGILPKQGGDPHPIWFRIQVRQLAVHGDWVLSTAGTSVQDMQFYGPFDASGQAIQAPILTGSLRPFANRPLASERLSMRLQLQEPGDYTVYVRATSLTKRVYAFRVWDIADFNADGQDKRLFDGLCYGILVAMLVYNLVLLLVFRDRTYALYVLSGGFALLTLVSFNGHVAHYLLPNQPVWADRMNVIFPALWIALGTLFAHSFLDLQRYAPTTARLVLLVTGLAMGSAVLGVLGEQTLAQAANEYVSLLGTAVVFVGAVLAWYRGFAPARWYLAGQLALFSTVILAVLINWGYFDSSFMEDNGLQIGVAVEVMVFAVALSSRIRLMQAVQTELKVRTAHLTVASETDPLTGVANRAGLASRAQAVLTLPHQRTLILLDLDQFKPINDQYGHEAGDAVLVEIARRIQAQLRSDDTVARVGGDEFVVLLNHAHERSVLEQISTRLLAAIAQPVEFAGHPLRVGGSLGIARFPGNGLTLPDLMQAADVAMYHVKRNGRAGFAFFEDMSDQEAQTAAQSAVVNRPASAAHWDI